MSIEEKTKMEQRFDFATNDTKAGFRLDFFELYNWGTYDKSIIRLRFDTYNALLTGDIGSGKSTVVDALTTLLVPHQKIVYNKAAGSESKERSLGSYILGEYKSSKDENFSSAKAVTLRESKDSFTVLLAHFKNDGYEEEVTLAQFFYMSNAQVHKFFVVSKNMLTIKKDFFDFSDVRDLKKRLRKHPHTSVYDTFTEYSKDFRRLMGIKNEQALNLFYQTVSLKSIGNLTQFIRQHMLEPSTMEVKVDELCQNFKELNHIHNLVLRAKRQIELLSPIDKEGKKYEKSFEEKQRLEIYREYISAYFASYKVVLLKERLSQLDIDVTKKESQKLSLDDEQEVLNSKMIDLKIELRENGGDRLSSIENEILYHKKSLVEKKQQNEEYNNLTKKLELSSVSNEHRFLNNHNDATKSFDKIEEKSTKLQNNKTEESVALKRYEENAKDLEIELIYLKNNRSNIPQRVSKIRDDMIVALGLKEDTLPFVGELIEVKESRWEGAIERVLHSFALSLLVESEYYAAVSAYVEQTNLKGKLVYLKINSKKIKEKYIDISPSSLLNKIELKASSPLFEPLNDMLKDRFNIPCVESMEEFRRFAKALTLHGQFKTNLSRHEKDDRFDINDSRRWVLGWDNASKLQKTQEDYDKELEKITYLHLKIKKIEASLEQIITSRDDLRDILKFVSFEQIDWYRFAKKVEVLKSEKEEISKSSDVIKLLQNNIEKTEQKIQEQKGAIDKLSQKIGELKSNIEQRHLEFNEAFLLVENADKLEELKVDMEELSREIVSETLNLNTIKTAQSKFRELIQKKIDTQGQVIVRSSQKMIKDMSIFVSEYQSDSKEFDASVESLEEFRFKLKELKKDNLPKWEKRFKELFREKTIQSIVIVQTELEHQSKEIEFKIEKINSSLKDIEYSDGTYIELMAQKSNNIEIREFKLSLKQAISGSIGDDNIYDEQKFLQIKEIIERLNGREGYSDVDKKWRKIVTDVRNWFDFSAMERYISDDSEKEYYPHSGGKSGGQKEKLAYTVLASSLAFQFGLEYDQVRSRSFRFVMIDEAFGRGSDESSRYALRLFEKLNLQLLVITPKQKINIIEPFVHSVHFVHNQDGMNSSLISMSIETFIKNKND
jgi:uncharacterized protein YPO0396